MFDTKLLPDKIAKLKERFENGQFADVLIGALNTANGTMQQRIFTENEDVQGNSFGKYIGSKKKQSDRAQLRDLFGTKSKTDKKRIKASAGLDLTAYQRKRANKGHQTNPKNLEFSGGLRRSIVTTIKDEKAVELEFNNQEAAIIAKGQEAQITNIRNGGKGITKGVGIKIFRLNQQEKEEVVQQGLELITQELKRT